MRGPGLLLAALLAAAPAPAEEAGPAGGGAPLADRVAALERQVRDLADRLRALEARQSAAGAPLPPAALPPPAAPSPGEPAVFQPGALAIARPVPADADPAEVPADSAGSFVYAGAGFELTDLGDRGVRLARPAGVELQGWLAVTVPGRHQLALDGRLVPPPLGVTKARCALVAWVEGREVGRAADRLLAVNGQGSPRLSLLVGVELPAPGFYRLRLWQGCAFQDSKRGPGRLRVEPLVKGPDDLTLRPFRPDEFVHRRAGP
ncbi:MAG TPA: hypothetical protein VEH84_07525 [Alphaproteobacteria bacterium]|nr:hypothetical protein [Alphaproteobacteria bacterium]